MKTKFKTIPMLLIAAAFFFTACNDEDETPVMESKNIVEVAADAGNFSTLIAAAQKAGLAEFLSTENNLTVFAPTDAAFAALLSDLGLSSLDDIPVADLTQILSYHVIGAKVMSADLSTGYVSTLASFDNSPVSMYVTVENTVSINGNISVTTADVEAENGVIHVVDKVILPPTVVNIALANENFTTLVQAVVKAGLVDALSADGPFTVFAPTNAAFDALFAQLGISGIDDLTAEQLIPILTYHVVSGNVVSTELSSGEVETLNGKNLSVDLSAGVKINESEVVAADIQGSNGVIHVIDQVLLPE
ncbi:fasciclin domain-containing protein [Mariniphaga sediminis]|uniref:Fasciclin domain-containing protein n=1 Tax=Mariniphaga sediminis TaxID=1628158 RepID=A0A399CWI6_9BACT|nr:fasciclin domain-containing protein [Mariniphaga sediminis]RIH63338.1 fasciclin domain-containing protein [Mariniphaga sediminis]